MGKELPRVATEGSPSGRPNRESLVFISYSHQDEALRKELDSHLAHLQHGKVIRIWHDRKIGAGEDWEGTISRELEEAQIVLLLISADFLASSYIRDKEMRRALERDAAGEAKVIPVMLRRCDWEGAA